MPRTTDLLTISVKTNLLKKMRSEARCQKTTVSALLRDAFLSYAKQVPEVYTDRELKRLLKADELPAKLKLMVDDRGINLNLLSLG